MALYRVLKTLWRGNSYPRVHAGSFSQLEWLSAKSIERLTISAAINEVHPPPLYVVPGWTRRAERLAEMGIDDALQFLNSDICFVAQKLKVRQTTIIKWQDELTRWFTAPPHGGS